MTTIPSPLIARDFTLVQTRGDFDLHTPQGCNDFRNYIALQAQGEIAVLLDDVPGAMATVAFATIYDVADEALLRLSNGQLIRIFLHTREPIAYTEKIADDIWNEIKKIKNKRDNIFDLADAPPEFYLDLALLWEQTKGDAVVTRTKHFIKLLTNKLRSSLVLHLFGEIPTLPLLVAVYLARPYGKEIFYQENAEARQVLLFS